MRNPTLDSTTIETNRLYYDMQGVVTFHRNDTQLFPVEAAILSKLRDELRNRPILDIGIGAGRTTPYLRAISRNYIGTDYSPKMIEAARKSHSGANLLVCDARNMKEFHKDQFAGIFFLGGGICDVSAKDRLVVLQEIYRILKPGGVFVMSAHNLDARVCGLPQLDFSKGFLNVEQIKDNTKRLTACLSCWIARLSLRASFGGYAIIRDYEDVYDEQHKHEGMLLSTYYIKRHAQLHQLRSTGFSEAVALDKQGIPVPGNRRVSDGFLHYLARKQ